MATTASLVIDFGGISDALLQAELDSVRNNDKSTFQAGDVVYFKIYSSVNFTIEPSSGTVSNEASDETDDIENEVVVFAGSATSTVQKPIDSILSSSWFDHGGGNSYGNIAKSNYSEVAAESADEDSVGVAAVSYRTKYDVFKLTPPVGMPATYHIAVLIKATL